MKPQSLPDRLADLIQKIKKVEGLDAKRLRRRLLDQVAESSLTFQIKELERIVQAESPK